MKKKVWALVLSAAMVAVVVSGCSSKKKETEAPTQAETQATEAATTEAAAPETEAAETVEEVATEAAETVEEVVTEAAEAAEELATEGAESVDEIAAVVEEAVSESVETAEELVTEAVEAAEEFATEGAESVAEIAGVIEEAVSEAVETVEEIATEEASEKADALLKGLFAKAEQEGTELPFEETEAVAIEETTEESTPVDYTVSVTDASVVGTLEETGAEDAEIVILYTNDIHGAVSSNIEFSGSAESLGFAGLAAVKSDVEEDTYVTLVDNGDADQGSVVTSESDGKDVQDLMAQIGYDLYIPGNHEFDYGMDAFLEYAEENGKFLSCNFVDNRTGEPVLNTHTVYSYDVNGQEFKIGFIGISTPETIAKSTPTYFQDEEGNYIYGFDVNDNQDLYDDVQEAADACRAEGADMVIALSHLGDTGVESAWSSFTVASETTGIDVFLDGHAHSFLPGVIASNKDGEDVLITSTGTKLVDIGVLAIDIAEDGAVTVASNLVNEITEDEQELDAYNAVAARVQEIEDGYAYLVEVKGTTDFDLVVNDPTEVDAEGNPIRIIRTQETNLADLITDAYRDFFGADIGIMNGGSIRATIAAGDIQYNSILAVMPWNSEVTLVEMSGATLLDMLEMGAHLYPEECGGFIHGSNLEYTIDSTIPSSVEVNSDGEFVAVNGDYRVTDVKVGGQPLDPEEKYTVAINSYYSEDYGDGMTMLKDATMLERVAEDGEPYFDHDVFITYLESFENSTVPEEYANYAGQGRLTILTEEDKAALAEETEALEDASELGTEAAGEL